MSATIKARRFTKHECDVLVAGVEESFSGYSVTALSRKKAWENVTIKVNAVHPTYQQQRSVKQVKRKWWDMKGDVKKRVSAFEKESIKTDGGKIQRKVLSDRDYKILTLIEIESVIVIPHWAELQEWLISSILTNQSQETPDRDHPSTSSSIQGTAGTPVSGVGELIVESIQLYSTINSLGSDKLDSDRAECFDKGFQKEIPLGSANFIRFIKFALSESGLCLNVRDLWDILKLYRGDEKEQKQQILNKWKKNNGEEASVSILCCLSKQYILKEIVLEDQFSRMKLHDWKEFSDVSDSDESDSDDDMEVGTPSCRSKSVNIPIKKHCTLSNVELIKIENILRSNSEVDLIEFCDCRIGNDYSTPVEGRKNTAKCKISKLIISYTEHFKEFSGFFYSTFGGCEIKSLCLVYANLDDQDVENLQSFLLMNQVKGIESLDISYNKKITQHGFEQISNMIAEQGIKILKAINCDLEKPKLEKLFKGLKNVNLRELDVGYNDNLTENGFEMLAELVASRGIKILKLRGCQLTEKTIKVFHNKLEKTDENVSLNELDVSYNPEINPAGCEVLGSIIKKFGISTLNLAGCGISEEHLISLMSKDIKLRALILRDNSYPGNILVEIAIIVSKFEIQELDISDCMFSVRKLRNFRTDLNETKLQKLHLGDKRCELGMEYIQEVCQLLQSVKILYLRFHRLDNSCRRLLKEQSERLSVSIQLCDEPQVPSNK